ncbi:MAG: dimethylhistidine N-methyltransferase [Rhodospirillales bacterium]|jgi:dimethylhistidine N-methyltransferase|nr:dimethylhistidine N-methyltransferase [Rhodospirillales bacterium]
MRSNAQLAEFHDHAPQEDSFRDAVLEGLARSRKAIPCRFLYDARGSALFDEICRVPEYYPTRTELRILEDRAGEIAALIGPHCQLIEFGSGSSIKVRTLLDALDADAYVPVDISRDHLRRAADDLAADFPNLDVVAICADYHHPFRLPSRPVRGRRFGFFPGSTIGNFEPDEAVDFLAMCADLLGDGGAMLVGIDLKKDAAILDAAYDDAAGVTAKFSLNLLARANRELGADFDITRFAHDAHYEEGAGRVEIYIRSLVHQKVIIAGRRFHLAQGERIHTEYSYKYTIPEFRDLARSAGFRPTMSWTDADDLFSVHYLETGG